MKPLDIYRLPGIDPIDAGLLRHSGHPTAEALADADDLDHLSEITGIAREDLERLRQAARDLLAARRDRAAQPDPPPPARAAEEALFGKGVAFLGFRQDAPSPAPVLELPEDDDALERALFGKTTSAFQGFQDAIQRRRR